MREVSDLQWSAHEGGGGGWGGGEGGGDMGSWQNLSGGCGSHMLHDRDLRILQTLSA